MHTEVCGAVVLYMHCRPMMLVNNNFYINVIYLFLSAWVQTSHDNGTSQLPEDTKPKNRKILASPWKDC